MPAVIFLCSEDCPTGHVIEAGGTYFARAANVESQGLVLGNATADDLAAYYDEIADLRHASPVDQGSKVSARIPKAVSKATVGADSNATRFLRGCRTNEALTDSQLEPTLHLSRGR